ncbi:MAG TPA: glycoside hydrolase family 27 protein [Cellulomonas sp.]
MTLLAATPPMGWNSWDSFGTTVTEAEVLANARFLHEHLLAAGWDTVVVDIAWYDPTARAHGYNEGAPHRLDGYGRQLPAENRFPSAAGDQGFAPLAAAVHDLGLRFGVHLLRGIPRLAVQRDLPVLGTAWTARDAADTGSVCGWNPDNYGLDLDHPAGQAYLDGQVAQLAAWGVDFLKVDDLAAPYDVRHVEAWSRAIARSGREMVLSLSPGTALSTSHLPHLREHAQMWRISNDLWDRWADVQDQFARLARWAPHQRPGGWADADMLPLGRIGLRAERGEPRDSRLTPDEQRTLITLWVMGRSPLMVGGDLPTSSPGTVRLLANPAVGEVLRHATDGGEAVREAYAAGEVGPVDGPEPDGELIVWTARSTRDATRYAAVFSTAPRPHRVSLPVSGLVPDAERPTGARDLWDPQAPVPLGDPLVLDVPAHGVRWLALT